MIWTAEVVSPRKRLYYHPKVQVGRDQDLTSSLFVDGSSSVGFAWHRETGGMIRQSAAMAVATSGFGRGYQARLKCFRGVYHNFSGPIARSGAVAGFTLHTGEPVRPRRMAANAVRGAFTDP